MRSGICPEIRPDAQPYPTFLPLIGPLATSRRVIGSGCGLNFIRLAEARDHAFDSVAIHIYAGKYVLGCTGRYPIWLEVIRPGDRRCNVHINGRNARDQ